MQPLKQNLPHMIMGAIAVIAAVLLAIDHLITGDAALAIIGTATGFTMATGAKSVSPIAAGVDYQPLSVSSGQTLTETTTRTATRQTDTPAATTKPTAQTTSTPTSGIAAGVSTQPPPTLLP